MKEKIDEGGLNEVEKEILRLLFKIKSYLPTNLIAEKTGYSWATVDKYLQELESNDFVQGIIVNSKERWRFNFDKYDKLKG